VQLDQLTVQIRPRSTWEAMDLGLRLVQSNWKAIYQPLLILLLPLFLLLNLVLSEHMWAAILVFWWFKPAYDRMILLVLSRSLFGDTPGWRETLRAFPASLRHGLLLQLTFLRLDPSRSFRLPVLQLEGLKGKSRGERMRVLQSRGNTNAIWLTITCMHLEYVINFALFALLYMLMPQNVGIGILEPFFEETPPFWADLASNFFYFLTVCMIEPFYVAAGFMLYINRRTQLEAWDIELSFRLMANRLKGLAGMFTALGLAVLLSSLPRDLTAEPVVPALPVEESSRVIKEVLSHEDFATTHTEERWRIRDLEWDWFEDEQEDGGPQGTDPGWLTHVASLIKWLAIAGVAGWLAWLLVRYRDELNGPARGKKSTVDSLPDAIIGLDIRPESLPDDIPEAARALWERGQFREALGLLYRAALSSMVNHRGIEISAGDTEADILSLSLSGLDNQAYDYLGELTLAWQLIAYAHRPADAAVFSELVDDWNRRFDTLATKP